MNILKQSILTIALLVGFSVAASAQKDGDKKPPPKEGKPPVIVVQPKPTPDKPKDGKKPNSTVFYLREEN